MGFQRVVGTGAALALASAAFATPRESVTYTGVASDGTLGAATNVVQTAPFTGTYLATKVRLSGLLRSQVAGTWPDDSRVQVTTPSGATLVIHPFTQRSGFSTISTTGDVVMEIPSPEAAAGAWSFRFYEGFDDGAGNDASWDTVTLTLDDEPPAPPAILNFDASGIYQEVEDNDRKSRANLILEMYPDQTIGGSTTGTSTTTGGAGSADYFRIKTVSAPPAIYKHRLTLGGTRPGQTASIRGLSQAAGVVTAGTDIAFQTGSTVQWYGFGRQEQVYYRVTGTTTTAADYASHYTRSEVTPLEGGTFLGGPITLDRALTNTADVDFFVYDSALNPVSGFQNDGPDRLVRDFPQGTYYVAWSDYNTSNDQPAPADDLFRAESVLDFPNAIANSSGTTYTDLRLRITDSTGVPVIVRAVKAAPFDIAWIRFVVVPPGSPTNPHGEGLADPDEVRASLTTLLTVAAGGGINPPSTGLAVHADLTPIGGAASQTLYDDGTHGDLIAGDRTFSLLATVSPATEVGDKTIPFAITDAQNRTGVGEIMLTVKAPPKGGCCTAGGCAVTTRNGCTLAGGTYNGDGVDCSGTLSGVLFASSNPFPLAIPDAVSDGVTPGSVTSTIVVPAGSGLVQHLVVDVGISHTYIGDVKLKVVHNGTQAALETRPGVIDDRTQTGSACNYEGVYTFFDATSGDMWEAAADAENLSTFTIAPGNFHPAGPYSADLPSPSLSAFEGMPFEGTWTLTAEDWWGDDTGLLTAFNLRSETPMNCGRRCGGADFDCDGDVGTDSDIEAFFSCLAGVCPSPPCASLADFDGDGDTATDADIEAFFRVLAGGAC